MSKLDKFALAWDKFETALLLVCAIALCAMMLITTADVIGRYFFRSPISWSMYFMSYFQVVVMCLGLGYVQAKKKHVRVDIIEHFFPRTSVPFSVIAYVALIAISAIIMWQGWNSAVDSFGLLETELAGTSNVPLWPWKFLLPLGFGIMIVQTIIDLLRFRSPSGPHDDTPGGE
jgi:TRAP-type C4-dicarboxylate transport system permease small subunit